MGASGAAPSLEGRPASASWPPAPDSAGAASLVGRASPAAASSAMPASALGADPALELPQAPSTPRTMSNGTGQRHDSFELMGLSTLGKACAPRNVANCADGCPERAQTRVRAVHPRVWPLLRQYGPRSAHLLGHVL